MAKKETSDKLSKLASDVLRGVVKPTPSQTRSLAGSVLGQDEHRGRRPQTPKKK